MNTPFRWEEYKRAIQNEFSIVNKQKEEVPFILNKAQDDLIQKLTEQNIILKARKMGFSSLLLAIGAIKFLFGRNERVVSMSFDQSASGRQLLRAKTFISSFEYKNNTKLSLKYNSKNEMVLIGKDDKGDYTNSLTVGTARSGSFGRGDDITFLHLTEVSQNNNLQDLLASVGEALTENAMLTLETTANGYGEFKDFWDASSKGFTGFKPFFYGSDWEYSQEYLERRRMKLGYLFPQEYPMTPDEAFIKMGGKVYTTFDLNKHVHEFEHTKDEYADYYFGLDFAVRGYTASIALKVKEDGHMYILDEYKRDNDTALNHSFKIKDMLTKYASFDKWTGYADPAGWKKDQQKADLLWSIADEYIEEDFPIIRANNEVTPGINYVKQLFSSGKIHIHPRCTLLVDELMQYQWKEQSKLLHGKQSDPEIVRKINDHLVDAMRYALYSKPTPPEEDESKLTLAMPIVFPAPRIEKEDEDSDHYTEIDIPELYD